jgi:hypothetical protein
MTGIKELTLDVKGTLQVEDPGSPGEMLKIVYQGCSPQFANYFNSQGKPRMVRTYVSVTNPGTPAQLARQEGMRQAVAAWQAATQSERETARYLADNRQITLYMAFISIWLKSYSPTIGTIWDGGATTWDSGSTTWDL